MGVSAYEIEMEGGSEDVFLDIYEIGNFLSDININALKRERGLKVWSVDRIVPGAGGNSTCFLGCDVYSHKFRSETEILWEIWDLKRNNI